MDSEITIAETQEFEVRKDMMGGVGSTCKQLFIYSALFEWNEIVRERT